MSCSDEVLMPNPVSPTIDPPITGGSEAEMLRKIIKTRGHFPSDDAASKLIWLALRNITAHWSQVARDWKAAMNQFAILYQDRFTRPQVQGVAEYRLSHRVARPCAWLAPRARRRGKVCSASNTEIRTLPPRPIP
jgi:hypothetical protein